MSAPRTDKNDHSMDEVLTESGRHLRACASENREQFVQQFRHVLDEKDSPALNQGFSWKEWLVEFVSRPMVPRLGIIAMIGLVLGSAVWGYMSTRPAGSILIQSEGMKLADGSRNLKKGQVVSTAENQHSLLLLDNSRIECYVGDNSKLQIHGAEQVALNQGEAWLSILPQSGHFAVDLPKGTIHVLGTSFGLNVSDESAEFFLSRGKIAFEFNGETYQISPDQLVKVNWTENSVETLTVSGQKAPSWVSKLYDDFQVAHHAAYFPSLGKK